MCAQYVTKEEAAHWRDTYGIDLPPDFWDFDSRILPYKKAPVVVEKKGEREAASMIFSLIPVWATEPKVKFPTHNARLESIDAKTNETVYIYEKPTWKASFGKKHCLIPISSFIEPAYHGKLEGHMVAFTPTDGELLSAAAIWSSWTNKKTGDVVDSFSIITDDPIPYVEKSSGHDRSPVFLKPNAFDEWLDVAGSDKEPMDWVKFLRKNSAKLDLDLEMTADRAMAKGWEKRR